MPRQHRHEYAADLPHGLLLGPEMPSTESHPDGHVHCKPAHIHQV